MGKTCWVFLTLLTVLSPAFAQAGRAGAPAGGYEEALEALAEQIEAGIPARMSIAVLAFEGLGGDRPDFARYTAEALSTTLARRGRFRVVERRRLDLILEELKLNASGLVDPEARKRFGWVLGVQAVLLGSYQTFPASVRLNARLVATEAGETLSAGQITAGKYSGIRKLLGEPVPGSILVQAEDGAKVFLDGAFVGIVRQGAMRVPDVEPGEHRVALRKPGKHPLSKTLRVEDSEDARVLLTMRRKPGPEAAFYGLLFPGAGSAYLGRSVFGGGDAKYAPMAISTVSLSLYLGAWLGERELVKKGEYRWAATLHRWKPYLVYAGAGMAALDVVYCFFAGTANSLTARLDA
ncbi:MAG TPA: CsgG/HfaB family protein, partial [Candidatus Glassbacteria bacterium]|nr:CsgG/HfaB family protein [Candidatus Glassbacteria bacterium]